MDSPDEAVGGIWNMVVATVHVAEAITRVQTGGNNERYGVVFEGWSSGRFSPGGTRLITKVRHACAAAPRPSLFCICSDVCGRVLTIGVRSELSASF